MPLVSSLRADIRQRARQLEKQVMKALVAGGLLEKIQEKAPPPETKAIWPVPQQVKELGDRTVQWLTADLEEIFANFEAGLTADLSTHAVGAYNVSGQNNLVKLGGSGSFRLRNPAVLQSLERRANMLGPAVTDEVFDGIRNAIRVGMWEQRRSLPQVAKMLEKRFDMLDYRQSLRIARTESLVNVEQATQDSFVANGIENKRWVATLGDGKTRPDHLDAHGQVKPIDEPFIIGGDRLMHPGDPGAPPEQTVNCRCDQVAEFEKKPDPDLIWTGGAAPSAAPLAA